MKLRHYQELLELLNELKYESYLSDIEFVKVDEMIDTITILTLKYKEQWDKQETHGCKPQQELPAQQ